MYSEVVVARKWGEAEARLQGKLGRGFRLKEYPRGESLSRTASLASAYRQDGTPTRTLTEEEVLFITNEITLAKISFRYWAERYCRIISEAQQLVPLVLRPTQQKLLTRWGQLEDAHIPLQPGKIALILLKPRQIGATVLSQAAIAHASMLHRMVRGLAASDIPENSLKLYQLQERIYDNLPPWMKPHMSGRVKADHLHYDTLDSDVMVGTGNQKNPLGQGVTLDHIHLTEVATWEPAFVGQIDDDMGPAFLQSRAPTSLFMIESTAKGMERNWFFEQYQNAKEEQGWFRSIFISWFDDPTKVLPAEGVTLTETTLAMAERARSTQGVTLSKEQMAFYQVTRQQFEAKERLEDFLQEFPSTDDEAFQTGWRSVFPITLRDKIRNEARPVAGVYDVDVRKKKLITVPLEKWKQEPEALRGDSRLLIWEAPRPGYIYVVGVDTSYGELGMDNSAVEVIRVGNKHRGDEQVAEWAGTIDPIDLSVVVEMVGKLFTDRIEGRPAKLAVEVNPGSPGLLTQSELLRKGYPHFYTWKKINVVGGGFTNTIGWYTTPSTRPLLTKTGVKYIKEGTFKVNSPYFIEEMKTYVNLGLKMGKEYLGHAPSFHDDRIMAGFIALYVAHEDDQVNVADERRHFLEQKAKPQQPRQYQASGMSWDEIMRHWEYGEAPDHPEDFN